MKRVTVYDVSDQQTRFIQSRSSASILHKPKLSFETTVNGPYGQSGGGYEGFSSITYLLSMSLVSVEKIRPIINKNFGER